ncbi:MAG: hypothetical protein ACLPLP_13015 [Mycobacterium sp.]
MTSPTKPNPVIFIHGLWIHSSAWEPWLDHVSRARQPRQQTPQRVEESDALHAAWTIPGAGRPLFEGAGANFSRHSPAKVDTRKADRGPLPLTSGTEDHTVPLKVTKEVFGMYSHSKAQTDLQIFEGRGHSRTIDNGWKDVADVALQWLTASGL